jgi:HAD superfamily hydrolase (TIGR01549 family)
MRPTEHLLERLLPKFQFEPILTRSFLPAKPDAAPLRHIIDHWKLDSAQVIMIGDGVHDMQAGKFHLSN